MDASSRSMQTYTGTLPGCGGVTLFEQGWHADAPPAAVVALVHGYAEHSGRYGDHARRFVDCGYQVCAYDHRGHGRSSGRPAYVHRFEEYVDDLAGFVEELARRHPGRPLFLMGHSMGGAVAALCVLQHAPRLAGLILSSPAVCLALPSVLQQVALVLGWLLPTLPTTTLDRSGLSHDAAVVQQAEADPLNFTGRMPARTIAEMIRAGRYIRAHAARLTLPLLILHGTDDPIIAVRGSEELYQQAGSDNKTLSLFDGYLHETFNEPNGRIVLDTVTSWIEEQLTPP